ncbi:hypothetical protein GPECTOR_20g518 [Gonium pectorale]|uniref:BTB domain-containing protein n=1 Tax=Gonium pectorale TaxID=33097 RepID=A0A150GIN1_GONPE|nr:hypothetical protein GPECTOR_20g518 [Gonium pectorale]|eukprot:KXZ49661.1 hypothetical protein GPECTOR_20g518 [Gonium pectorale]
MRLDASNVVSPIAIDSGSRRLNGVAALAADGLGNLYAAEKTCIYKLSGLAAKITVTTLTGQAPGKASWVGVTYNPATGALLAATSTTVYSVHTGSGTVKGVAGPGNSSSVSCSSGRLQQNCGAAASFTRISSMTASGYGQVYIMDDYSLREMTAPAWHVHTIHDTDRPAGSIRFSCSSATTPAVIAITSTGWLAVGDWHDLVLYGPGFKSTVSAVPTSALLRYLASAPAPTGGEASSNGGTAVESGTGASESSVLTVRVGDRAFAAHRVLLAERCEFFKKLLAVKGFAESGAAEVTLGEADPDVFGRLLAFIYWGVLDVPATHLKAAVELAGRLLMPEVCELLKPRLLAACTPATVVSDLLWAEKYGLTGLVPLLTDFLIEHLKAAVAAAPEQVTVLTARSPALAAEVIRTMAREEARK